MNTTIKMILGITVAAVASAVIGMWLAPEKGVDLQKKIKEGAKDWMNDFTQLLGTGKELISDFKNTTQDKFEEGNFESETGNRPVAKMSKY